jgi:hypothetical protein
MPAMLPSTSSSVSASASPAWAQLALSARAASTRKVPLPQAGSRARLFGGGIVAPGFGMTNSGSPSWFSSRSASPSGV